MTSRVKRYFGFGVGIILGSSLLAPAFAQVNDAEYLKLLGTAQKFAVRQKARGSDMLGLSSRTSFITNHRFYSVGETWTVAVTPEDNPQVRKSESPDDLGKAERKPFYYDFKVLSVDPEKSARIEVRQRLMADTNLADPRIERLELVVSNQFVLIQKKIFYRDGRAPLTINQNGVSNIAVGFDAYPIDLPDLSLNDGVPLREAPKGIEVDVAKTLDFNFHDLYARPIRVLWQDGDPWPAYVQKASATAVLVLKGRRS